MLRVAHKHKHTHTYTRHSRAIHRHIQSHIPSHWPRTHCVGGQKRKLRVMGRGAGSKGGVRCTASQGRAEEVEAAKRITRIHKRGDRQSQVASSCLPLSVCLPRATPPSLPAIAARGVCLWSARSSCCQFVCQITKTPLPHRHRYAPRDASSDAPARTFHQYILPSVRVYVCACVCVYF